MLGNRVKEFREMHGLSQGQLAERSGVSARLINLLETVPGYEPQSRVMRLLCQYFQVDLERLFWVERQPDRTTSGHEPEKVAV